MESSEIKKELGLRYDAGKLRYDLLPPDGIEELVKVYTMGAQKYADHNWEKGMSWSRVFGSMMRHAFAFWRGQDRDTESGLPHMAHVAWNAIALLTYGIRKVGVDDRYNKPEEVSTPEEGALSSVSGEGTR